MFQPSQLLNQPMPSNAPPFFQSTFMQNVNPNPIMQPAPPAVQNNNTMRPLDTNGRPQQIYEEPHFTPNASPLPSLSQYMPPAGQQAVQPLMQGFPQGLSQGFSQGLSQGGQTVGAQPLMQGLSQVSNSFGQNIIQKLPEGFLSPDTQTDVGLIASNPIANASKIPSVFTNLTKDVEKKLLVTVLERFKTILELFKQPASDAVNALLKKELDALTENMNDPSLRPIVDKLSRAAEIPINRFLDNLTDIIQRYFPALVGKLFNTAGNVIGEIPVVGVFVNAALAFSNVLNTVRTTTDMVDRTSVQFQSLQDELTNALNNLVNDTQAHVGQALDPTSIMKKNASGMSGVGHSGFGHSGVGLKGGSASRGGRKMHTLKRIHTSIKQFIHTNKRTLKRSYKKPRRH